MNYRLLILFGVFYGWVFQAYAGDNPFVRKEYIQVATGTDVQLGIGLQFRNNWEIYAGTEFAAYIATKEKYGKSIISNDYPIKEIKNYTLCGGKSWNIGRRWQIEAIGGPAYFRYQEPVNYEERSGGFLLGDYYTWDMETHTGWGAFTTVETEFYIWRYFGLVAGVNGSFNSYMNKINVFTGLRIGNLGKMREKQI